MELIRIVQIFIIQLLVGVIYFLAIAWVILYRNRKTLNKIFASFFVFISLGSITNIIYSLISVEMIVTFLHILAFFFFSFALVFVLIFILIILRSKEIFTPKKQRLILFAYTVLFSSLFIVGLGLEEGVVLDPSTNWNPKWSLPFFVVVLMIVIPLLIFPILYYAFQVFKDIGGKKVKRKWKFFMIGIIIYAIVLMGTGTVNFLDISFIRNIWGIFALVLFLMAYTIYYGVGKKIE